MSIFGDVSKGLLPLFLATNMAVAGADGVQANQAQDDGLSVIMALSPVWVVAIDENKERIDAFVKRQRNTNDFHILAARLGEYKIEKNEEKFKLHVTFNLGSLDPDKWIANGYVDCSYKMGEPSTKCLWSISPKVDDSLALKKRPQEKRPQEKRPDDDELLNIQKFPIDSKQIDWTLVQWFIDSQNSDYVVVKQIVEQLVGQHSNAHVVLKGQIPSWLKPDN